MNYPDISNAKRLAAVRETGLLDTEPEEVFDRLTRLAVKLLRVPAAFISLVDANRDFYKSASGFGEPFSTARELSGLTLCHYAVQQPGPLVIPDTAADPVYRNVPTVKTLRVAAYVGVPLVVGDQVVGAFCTIDTAPHAWTADEVDVLVELAASAQREIELRVALEAVKGSTLHLEQSNRMLQEQAVELQAQTEALRSSTAYLEELTSDAQEATRAAEASREDALLARAEAEAANRVKGEFLAIMSHELRTPLNAIGGYTDLIEMGVHGPVTEGQLGAITRIKRSQKQLLNLINGLLSYAQIDAGAVTYEVEDFDLNGVVSECEQLTAPQMEAKHFGFAHDPSPMPVIVRADRAKTVQIVLNLMSNAVKFTDPNGSLSVTSAILGSGLGSLEFADTGRGIPHDQLERIFLPFVQVDAKLSRSKEGTGLGLSISRNLARGMGGDVVPSSSGAGSVFVLTLPLASQPMRAQAG